MLGIDVEHMVLNVEKSFIFNTLRLDEGDDCVLHTS